MGDYTILKIIVQPKPASRSLLAWIDARVVDYMNIGIMFRIEKLSPDQISEKTISFLESKNIVRLPVLIPPDEKPFVGKGTIIKALEENMAKYQQNLKFSAVSARDKRRIGTNGELSEFYASELYDYDDKEKKLAPRKDNEEDDENRTAKDFDKRMREYAQGCVKYNTEGGRRKKSAPPEQAARGPTRPDNIATDDYDDYDDDNGGDGNYGDTTYADADYDDLNDRMMATLMDKGGGGH